tara:strand:+ start:516 stop:686 length:171 start_codon:yes stop_codon:yes gene_type:complete
VVVVLVVLDMMEVEHSVMAVLVEVALVQRLLAQQILVVAVLVVKDPLMEVQVGLAL